MNLKSLVDHTGKRDWLRCQSLFSFPPSTVILTDVSR